MSRTPVVDFGLTLYQMTRADGTLPDQPVASESAVSDAPDSDLLKYRKVEIKYSKFGVSCFAWFYLLLELLLD